MNIRHHFIVIALLLLSALTASAQTAPPVAAHWTGAIQGLREFQMVLDLARNDKGDWIGSLSLPFFNQTDVPLDQISVDGTSVQFVAAGTNYDGKISADGSIFSGIVAASIGNAPFQLQRVGAANVKVPPPSSGLSKEFEGNWEGSVQAPSRKLRVHLKFGRSVDGLATGTAVAIDEGSVEFPITTITQSGKNLQFEIRGAAQVQFSGVMDEAGSEISGSWKEGGASFPFAAQRVKE